MVVMRSTLRALLKVYKDQEFTKIRNLGQLLGRAGGPLV